jgi:DNA adenine methylase Dam
MKFVVRNGSSRLRLIPYIGNKAGFAHIFDRLIPNEYSDLKFYDVFGGGGAFTFYACERFGSKHVIYNDNNSVVVNLIKYVKDDPCGLISEYRKHQVKSSTEYYYALREEDIAHGLVGAGRFLYLAKNAFSGKIRFNPRGKFNCPMRKGSKCPNLDERQLLYVSKLIQELTIHNRSFEYFSDVTDSFIYLDPPYMNNPNWHYNGLVELDDFMQFVDKVKKTNKIMISEQNKPETLGLSSEFAIYDVFLHRSLQYDTQESSEEIIALNYNVPSSHLEKFRILNLDVFIS